MFWMAGAINSHGTIFIANAADISLSTHPQSCALNPASSQSTKPSSRLYLIVRPGADTAGFPIIRTDVLEEVKRIWLH